MKSGSKRQRVLTLIVALLTLNALGHAQAPPQEDGTPSTTIRTTVNRYGSSYTVNIDYDYRKALAGSQNLEINVMIETVSSKNLRLVSCERCDPGNSVFSRMSGPVLVDSIAADATSAALRTKYRLTAGIKKETEPQEYNVDLRLEPPDAENLRRTDPLYSDSFVSFPLYVGDLEKGLLSVKEPAKPKPELCTSGKPHSITLMLHNDYRDYTVNVQKVIISTEPASLLESVVAASPPGKVDRKTITLDAPLTIPPRQDESLTIDVQMAGMAPGNYLSGFDEDSQFQVRFVYDDGKGRTLSNYSYPKPLRMQPRFLVLSMAVLLGISVGLFLMSVWKILKYEGSGLRRGLAILSTVVIALVVSILALQGELNISFEAFKIRASYDKPLMLFILSLFATVMGTPVLRRVFGLGTSDSQPASPSTPAT